MSTTSATNFDGARILHTTGEGNLARLIYVLLAFAGVIAVMSWYPVFAQGYEVTTAAKLACNDGIKVERFGAPDEAAKKWTEVLVRGAGGAGVRLTEDDYSLKISHDGSARRWVCEGRVNYKVKCEIALIGDILALEPIKATKHIRFTHEVPEAY